MLPSVLRFSKIRYAIRFGAIKNKIAQDAGKTSGFNAAKIRLTSDGTRVTSFVPAVRHTHDSAKINAIPRVKRYALLGAVSPTPATREGRAGC